MFMNITGIDLFDQNVGMACTEVRHRCSWLPLVLIYLIKIHVRWANKFDSDIDGYQWY